MPKQITIRECDEAQFIGRDLIDDHHPHLKEAEIIYLETDQKVKCVPHLLSPFERYLSTTSGEYEEGYDFALILPMDWKIYPSARQKAYVDHLLSHCKRETDNDGVQFYAVQKLHDIEEFQDVLERHGAWHEQLAMAVRTAKQLKLPTSEERWGGGSEVQKAARKLVGTVGRDGVESMTISAAADGEPIGEPVTITAEDGARARGEKAPPEAGG